MLAHTIQCAELKLDKKIGYFELIGCDIIIDEKLDPYLLELNSNPALFTTIEAHQKVIPKVVKQVKNLLNHFVNL